MKDNTRQVNVFTLMVDNEFGVLTRITALIRRAGWNIRSLAVAETAVPEVSRLTVALECRHNTLDSVLERLGKQSCVHSITLFEQGNQAARELCLLRVDRPDEGFAGRWNARLVSQGPGGAVLEICCDPGDTEAMLADCKALGLRDMARTGTIALRLGDGKEGR